MKKIIALILAIKMLMMPTMIMAAPFIPGFYGKIVAPAVNTLPVFKANPGGGATVDQSGNQMNITQNQGQSSVIIDWSSFNIGSNSTVRFYQGSGTPGTSTWTPNSSYAALNRIYDKNPSLIYGSLKADGKVYLINQNGILFGPGSQVIATSLAASTLNLRDPDFVNFINGTGPLQYTAENYQDPGYIAGLAANRATIPSPNPQAAVSNHGVIAVQSGGSVYLIAPIVENNGSITAPNGSINLISALPQTQKSGLTYDLDVSSQREVLYAQGVNGGTTVNYQNGQLSADSGKVVLSGATVENDGMILALSTAAQNGTIQLRASDLITTKPGSVIASPISDSSETIIRDPVQNPYTGGIITMKGLTTISLVGSSSGVLGPLNQVQLGGAITSPYGTVTLSAAGLVYLDTGSSIDVSGLWVNEPAGANLIDVQLNSIYLRDDYGQKNGILKGATLNYDPLTGSIIGNGNLSSYVTGTAKTAQEQSTQGGTIDLSATNGAIVVRSGADINFSGGGFKYAAGNQAISKLVNGTTVYDFSNAPEWLSYSAILGTKTVSNAKFGVTQTYNGLYCGGGNSVNNYSPAYAQGSNAGALSLQAAKVVLDGKIEGKATPGPFQTVATTDTNLQYNIAAGIEQPLGGTLAIGNNNTIADTDSNGTQVQDYRLGDVVLEGSVPAVTVTPATVATLPATTYLSTAKLSGAGLSKITIDSNLSVSTAAGSSLTLDPGSTLTVNARRIVNNGNITIHDGTVSFALVDNDMTSQHTFNTFAPQTNPNYIPLQERIFLADGSGIDVSGVQQNNMPSYDPATLRNLNYLNGGTVSLTDTRELGTEVIVNKGAGINVDGGYSVDAKGKVTGGNAGAVTLAAPTVVLDGDLHGFSLPGNTGGTITLQAEQVNVTHGGYAAVLPDGFTATSVLPSETVGQVTVADGRFDYTGFTNLNLYSYQSLDLGAGVTIRPSYEKLAPPVGADSPTPAGSVQNLTANGVSGSGTVIVSADYVGPSSFSAKAGDPLYTGPYFYNNAADNPAVKPPTQQLSLAEWAQIDMTPNSKVTLQAPVVDIAGTISAPAGTISVSGTPFVTSLNSQVATGNVTIESTGKLLAAGYNKPNSNTISGVAVGPTPVDAGSVSLTAAGTSGNLTLATGSLIDVSGSAAVENMQASSSGAPTPVMVAGNAGKVSMTFSGNLLFNGQLDAKTALAGVSGGTLTVNASSTLTLSSGLIGKLLTYQGADNGFENLAFKSNNAINFADSVQISAGYELTLDAPVITAQAGSDITLSAPWLRLQNESGGYSTASPAAGTARLALSGQWIDIVGGVQMGGAKSGGFSDISLTAQQDLRLSDFEYLNIWNGSFITPGNLTIQAGRVYPTTQSVFTLSAGKKVTILPVAGAPAGPVYSAGGSLTINGVGGVEQDGVVEAPFGQLTLQSPQRVYLGDNSVTSTAGESMTLFGTMDSNTLLDTYMPHSSSASSIQVTGAPQQGVTLNGKEVIVKDAATVNISGGGSVFSYAFQANLAGSNDPFQSPYTRYVILPDNSVQYPGDPVTGKTLGAVYIAGGAGIKAGVYSLLPEEYAFLPGAMVITPTGSAVAPGQQPLVSTQGYPVVGGYVTELGTNIKSPQLQGFSVQTAAQVMQEGDFQTKNYIAGNAGTLTVTGTSVVLGGAIQSAPLTGYTGGTLVLSSTNVIVQADPVALFGGFDFSSSLTAAQSNNLVISDKTLNGKGLAEVDLGNGSTTNSVTIMSGSSVDVPSIVLTAGKTIGGVAPSITVESGASLSGSSAITLLSNDTASGNGIITIGDGATIHAGTSLSITANSAALKGNITIDQGGFASLTSGQLTVVAAGSADDASRPATGMSLTDALWTTLAGKGSLSLTSTSNKGVTFLGDLNLAGGNSITIDTPLLTGVQSAGGTGLNISANSINLLNSSANIGASSQSPTGSVLFTANTITLGGKSDPTGQGKLLLDGFKAVTLASSGDLTMMGQGTLSFGGWSGTSPGQLVMTGARLVTAPYAYRDPLSGLNTYQRGDFTIDGGNGAVSFSGSTGIAGASTWAGGRLQLIGDSISVAGIIDVPAGEIDLTAKGAGGIDLGQGAQILSQGVLAHTAETGIYTAYAGGTVSLTASAGPVTVEAGTLIDVSAANLGAQGDAGTISLSAPSQGTGVTLNGDIYGIAKAGRGGSLTLDSYAGIDLTALNARMQAGRFNETIDIRAHTGDLTVAATDTIKAMNISLTADIGTLTVSGTLDASGTSTGGMVTLNAMNLSLASGSLIDVHGAAQGGEVVLNAGGVDNNNNPMGLLDFASGATIVASGATAGTGGTVHFRAPRYFNGVGNTTDDNDIRMTYQGTLTGASLIEAEAVKVYNYDASVPTLNTLFTDAGNFINNFKGSLPTGVLLLPGIEIRSTGDITLSAITGGAAWDLSTWGFGPTQNVPGVLTLRAAGNLDINAKLIDEPSGPTPVNSVTNVVLEKRTAQPSWGFNLVAGADLTSADPLAVQPLAVLQQQGTGNLTINDGVMVYTEKAPIRFAAGNDMNVTLSGFMQSPMISENMPFSLGTYDGEIRGTVGNDLNLSGGIIESATGDIDIRIGGSLNLFSNGQVGSIRTTGEYNNTDTANDPQVPGYPLGYFDYWNYQGGGNISLIVGNGILGQVNPLNSNVSDFTPGWDMATTDNNGMLQWSACYVDYNDPYQTNPNPFNSRLVVATQGIATMGGGNITIQSNGDVTGQFGAFGAGPGNLLISAGGDLKGRFLVRNGVTLLTAGGNFAPLSNAVVNPVTGQITTPADGSLIEAFYDTIRVTAQGNVTLGTVVNPTIASGDFAATDPNSTSTQLNWYLDPGYENSSVGLTAVNGDISILGNTSLYTASGSNLLAILPPTLNAYAGGSITLSSIPQGSSGTPLPIAFAPSSNGTLRLVAGLDISAASYLFGGVLKRAKIFDMDIDPQLVYKSHPDFDVTGTLFNSDYNTNPATWTTPPTHEQDYNPNVFEAQRDIYNLTLYLPKATQIQAKRDITDIDVEWQNVRPSDVSSIIAGRDITFDSLVGNSNIIHMGGPGSLLVIAGDSIDLGTSQGIQEVGNGYNSALPNEKSTLFVAAGTPTDLTANGISAFFPALLDAGINYSNLLALGENSQAAGVVAEFRNTWVTPLFGTASGSGTINMTESQISTSDINSNIYILSSGNINVGQSVINTGKTASAQTPSTGIYTASGGSINIFAKGDLNVNESRVQTFDGGDITGWSDLGSINAGRGSKTAISASPPKFIKTLSGFVEVFSPPSVGSGIRAVAYDPNVSPGNIYLFAPQGDIDAGEAGIAGGKVILGATEVLNAQNIAFSAGSVGVPAANSSSFSIGSLSGNSGLADSTKMIEQSTGAGAARDALKNSSQVLDDFMSKFLDVKVISFDEDDSVGKDKDKDKR